MQMIQTTEHEKSEWSRMANAAYSSGHNDIGHRYSVASACCLKGASIPLHVFDTLQRGYRNWLCFNDFTSYAE